MASSTRKRKKPNSSHPSSPSPSRSQSQQRNTTSTQEDQSDQTKGEDNDQPTSTAPIETTDEEELKKAQKVAAAAQSPCYAFYMTPELSTQRDKKNLFMIAYPCKISTAQPPTPLAAT
ncbi:hypothetical protein PGT21_026918 [Puccinia graminis f. sp. tritici]|uniref:Uncharacterized protein n=1 Tax=Puccinia graminis f. sp. tritici TaxID=56615 RepID=A0A5B0LXD2_PUCGR|nr:hypothetical protein PGT21_026918 [Puccinia graminis f. sp. tritici]